MPKNIHTPRDELICGKLDKAVETAQRLGAPDLVFLLHDIRRDAERMEAKLVSRKEEVERLASTPPAPPEPVGEKVPKFWIDRGYDRDPSSVIYRVGDLTEKDYDEAIEYLQAAKTQLKPDGRNCACCTDGGHQAMHCHHNPLFMVRKLIDATEGWRCFHCGAYFTDEDAARDHFGENESMPAVCTHPQPATTAERQADIERVEKETGMTVENALRHIALHKRAALLGQPAQRTEDELVTAVLNHIERDSRTIPERQVIRALVAAGLLQVKE